MFLFDNDNLLSGQTRRFQAFLSRANIFKEIYFTL